MIKSCYGDATSGNVNVGKHSAKVVTILSVNKMLEAILGLETYREFYAPSSNMVMGSISVVPGNSKYFNSIIKIATTYTVIFSFS